MHTALLIYSWLVRVTTAWLPDAPAIMRVRGWLYARGMKRCGRNLQVAHDAVLTAIETMELGEGVYFANGCVVLGGGRIEIGDDVLFGPLALVASGNHQFNGRHFKTGGPPGSVVVEGGSWVGGHASLLPGTRVRARSVVGAGAVCNRDYVESEVLVAGVPAEVVKKVRMANV